MGPRTATTVRAHALLEESLAAVRFVVVVVGVVVRNEADHSLIVGS